MGCSCAKPARPEGQVKEEYQKHDKQFDLEKVESQNYSNGIVLDYEVPVGCTCYDKDSDITLIDLVEKETKGVKVYRALLPDFGIVAAKAITPEDHPTKPEYNTCFDEELKILHTVDHPNITSFYGYQEVLIDMQVQRRLFIEFCIDSLATRVKHLNHDEKYRLKHEDMVLYSLHIANGLAYLHGSGVLHRNINPSNIVLSIQLLNDENRSKVMAKIQKSTNRLSKMSSKSGISEDEKAIYSFPYKAKIANFANSKHMKPNERATTLIGTINYVCPEMMKRESYGFECDIWSFGTVIYEMLTGTAPFHGKTDSQIYSKIIYGKFPKKESVASKRFQGLEKIMRSCLSFDEAKRANAKFLVDELTKLQQSLQ